MLYGVGILGTQPLAGFLAPASTHNAYTLTAATGTFTLTGEPASLVAGRRLSAAVGAFTLSGQAAGLRAARRLSMGLGIFTLSGQPATLTHGGLVPPIYPPGRFTGDDILARFAAADAQACFAGDDVEPRFTLFQDS